MDQSDENEDSPQSGELGSLHTEGMQSTQDSPQSGELGSLHTEGMQSTQDSPQRGELGYLHTDGMQSTQDSPQRGELGSLHTEGMQSTQDSPQRELGSLHTDGMQSTQDNGHQTTIQPVFISQEVEVELLQNNDTEAPLAEASLRSQSPVIPTTAEQIHTPPHTDEQTQLVLEIEILDTRDEAEVENLQGSYDPLAIEHELSEAQSLSEEESVIESNNHHNVVP